jgi:hypothetical protein
MARRLTITETGIQTFDRQTFFHEVFDYHPGDCCTFLAPFGGGKTQIAFEALAVSATPDLQATVFVMKPKDATVTKFAAAQGFETIRDWPPSQVRGLANRVWGKKPPGYVLWPKDTGNPEYDDYMQEQIFRRAIRDMYNTAKKKPNIMFADETYSLENELHLTKDLVRAWTKGRSVGNGLWAGSQRAAFISMWAYQAQHLFIGHDPDRKAQDRYADIGGGFDPEVIKSIIAGLKRFQFLYISREERAMCIVDAS